MIRKLTKFFRDEDGAVTVEWVVLTAAIVGLGITVTVTSENATLGLSGAAATAVAESTTF